MDSMGAKPQVKRTKVILAAIVLVLLFVLALMFVRCSSVPSESGNSDGTDTDITEIEATADDDSGEPLSGIPEIAPQDSASQTPDDASHAAGTDLDTPSNPSQSAVPNNSEGARAASAPSTADDAQSKTQEPAKRWVEDKRSVWVVDAAAWTEQVPTYATSERSICNICNTDITGNTSAHGKEHMVAGEGSGHHSEVKQVVSGYDTVNHPEQGHWETRVTGGHWE